MSGDDAAAADSAQADAGAGALDTGDWTDETLALLRALRAPHRRSRAGQIGYAVYSMLLFVLSWGGLFSLGLFANASMGADYTADGPHLLAALPSGVTALSLGFLLVVARDALWRGPVVAPRATVDWLLMQPVRPGPVLRPWFAVSCAIALVPGVLAAAAAAVALGLMEKVPFLSGLGWALVGGVLVPLLATAGGVAVERFSGVARWVRRATPVVATAVLLLAGQSVLAVMGHRSVPLERVEMWSGPWGWPALAGLQSTGAAQSGGWLGAVLLAVLTVLAVGWAHRAAAGIPLGSLRLRARTAAGVAAALRTAELRSARLVLAQGEQRGRKVRLRIPPPQRAALIVPWRDLTALLRAPSRFGRAVLFAAPALLLVQPAASARGADRVLLTALAVAFGYLGVAQLAEPARVEADDPRRAGWSPYPYAQLMLRHAMVPAAAAVLLMAVGAGIATALGVSAAVWLAPAAALPLTAAAMVNACRGPSRQELMYTPRGAGGMGPFLFLAWYAAGPLTTVPALAFALGSRPLSAALWCLLCAAVLMYWSYQRALTLSGRHRPKD
ncbi:hypothetical protein GXW83_27850 [Streptacidiphilus sp. PB12-B1b]|uniref:hypothetical protein n=1 Tax=Streptacidiphilus sp. PB12-B1b TaxID=2705012 RepID=UPI0015FD2E95|nr:hypothetical protein [Streptacidiphilus sp. PB12-B1b]QMU78957.1 hypothetical protein GXW83_27850 [Streptacidiphilus sp. PB12-B1b]